MKIPLFQKCNNNNIHIDIFRCTDIVDYWCLYIFMEIISSNMNVIFFIFYLNNGLDVELMSKISRRIQICLLPSFYLFSLVIDCQGFIEIFIIKCWKCALMQKHLIQKHIL